MHVGGLAQKKEHEPHGQNLGSALCSLEDLGQVIWPHQPEFLHLQRGLVGRLTVKFQAPGLYPVNLNALLLLLLIFPEC